MMRSMLRPRRGRGGTSCLRRACQHTREGAAAAGQWARGSGGLGRGRTSRPREAGRGPAARLPTVAPHAGAGVRGTLAWLAGMLEVAGVLDEAVGAALAADLVRTAFNLL